MKKSKLLKKYAHALIMFSAAKIDSEEEGRYNAIATATELRLWKMHNVSEESLDDINSKAMELGEIIRNHKS